MEKGIIYKIMKFFDDIIVDKEEVNAQSFLEKLVAFVKDLLDGIGADL